jgi:hypothetical protein
VLINRMKLSKLKQILFAWGRGLIAIALSLVAVWMQTPIAAAQPVPPKPMLMKQATDTSAPQPMTDQERAALKDPLFTSVLKDRADATSLTEINKLLKATGQDVFVVDERIVDTDPKPGGQLAFRRAIVTPAGAPSRDPVDDNQNVLFSVGFNSEQFPVGNFIEAMGWDNSQGQFNYYKFDQSGGETKPSWKFRGSSKDADVLTTANRQGTCMQCHINGGLVMKEFALPWNHWDSFSAKTPYLLKGNTSWNVVKAANSPLKDLKGAEDLEIAKVAPGNTRFNERRINALKSADGKTITDARRLLKPIFVTTEFNLASSDSLSPLHPFSKPSSAPGRNILPPVSFFSNFSMIGTVDVFGEFLSVPELSSKDYAHLVTQTKTSLNGKQPGDANFAWFGPEPSHIDIDFVRQLVQQEIVPKAFVAAALAVDVENPVLSSDRAKLWDSKILPAQFKIGAQNDLIPQTIKNLEALRPASGTPEALFLQGLKSPDPIAALQTRVDQYANREKKLLDPSAGATPKTRSDEWIRLYKLELKRREAVLADPTLKSLDETNGKLMMARGDVNAAVSPLPSTIAPRPTLRQGSKGNDVTFLQQRLKALGFFNGTVDGDFGPMTKTAVIAFQKKSNLEADGVVGPKSWAILQA